MFLNTRTGQGLVEYTLLCGLIFMSISALALLSAKIAGIFETTTRAFVFPN